MKIQDISFIIALVFLILLKRPRWLVISGMVAILLSMPLFHLKIALFTAQRLVMYAAAFFLANVIIQLMSSKPSSPAQGEGLDHYK